MDKDIWKKLMGEFYEEFRAHSEIFDYKESVQWSREAATSYAQMIIKGLWIVNGGALLAIPAIITSLDIKLNDVIIYATVFFSIGISSALLCGLFAYFSVSNGLQMSFAERFGSYSLFILRHLKDFYGKEISAQIEDDQKEYEQSETKFRKLSHIHEALAVLVGLISLASFIFGASALLWGVHQKINNSYAAQVERRE